MLMSDIKTEKNLKFALALFTVIAIMFVVFGLLVYFGPSAIFELFRGIMTAIALNLISSIHGILR
jgi:hypothetical protein